MKKKNWLKIIAIVTISLSCMIYIAVSLIHSHKVNNFVLRDSCVFENVKTTHFTCNYTLAYIPSFPPGENGQDRFESYNITADELTLVYVKDPLKKDYVTAYDKDHIITDPEGTIKISYASDQETSLYEQAEATYASYSDSERYELLEHSYLPPEDDNYTTWEEVYANYYLTIFPEHNLNYITFQESEWDKEAFRFAVLDLDTKHIIEVIYFERTDGIYCVEMNYPRNNEEVRSELYEEFIYLKINADTDPIAEMHELVKLSETWEDDYTLTLTAVNNSNFTIPNLSFSFNYYYTQDVDGLNGGTISSIDYENVKPGEEVSHTFTLTNEEKIYLESYDTYVYVGENGRHLSESDTLIFGE